MNKVAEKIAEAIKAEGAVSFARFMELALYCPVYGYYEREADTVGRRGDYFTSVSVGSLFGELLAAQFADWLAEVLASKSQESRTGVQRPAPKLSGSECDGRGQRAEGRGHGPEVARIVEAGAHSGQLAGDILGWLREQRPGLFARLEYCIVEPSVRRQQWQQGHLAEFGAAVRWVKEMSELAVPRQPGEVGGVRGIIFANELLDALPVQQFRWDAQARAWVEWGVTIEGEGFAWTRIGDGKCEVRSAKSEVRSPKCEVRSAKPEVQPRDAKTSASDLELFLPDGFRFEVCPAAETWWREAAGVLAEGRLLTLDYGLTAEELFAPGRPEATLRAYYRHRQTHDVLAHPGEQDLTAHVNFSAIQAAGESAGLETAAFQTQEAFLTRIAARRWQDAASFGAWTPAGTRQFQTLTHPEHLGRAFRVLVQTRRLGRAS